MTARLLGHGSTPPSAARSSYLNAITDGLFTSEALEDGEELLVKAGVFAREEGGLSSDPMLQRLLAVEEAEALRVLAVLLLERERPPWLASAVRGSTVQSELIPEMELARLRTTFRDGSELEATLLSVGHRYDPTARPELGEAGEEFVVAQCRQQLVDTGATHLVDRVQRVSLISDQLGYDVASPDSQGAPHHLEVKAIGMSVGPLRVFVSRNEAEVGTRDPYWALVVCRRNATSSFDCLGWCRGLDIDALLPKDVHPRGRWSAAELTLPPSILRPGLPVR